jgi:hypothetical protein
MDVSLSGKIAVGIYREKKHEQVECGAKEFFHGVRESNRIAKTPLPERWFTLNYTMRELI